MASNLIAVASNLRVITSNLLAMASNLMAMANALETLIVTVLMHSPTNGMPREKNLEIDTLLTSGRKWSPACKVQFFYILIFLC